MQGYVPPGSVVRARRAVRDAIYMTTELRRSLESAAAEQGLTLTEFLELTIKEST